MCGQETKNPVDISTTEVISPSGTKAYVVKCTTSDSCYTIAGRMCPAGYARVDGWYGNKKIVHFSNNTTALIQCKERQANIFPQITIGSNWDGGAIK